MKVTVSKSVPKELVKDLKEATRFYANLLMDPRIVRSLSVRIKFVKYDPAVESLGYCEVISDRSFVIEILDDGKENPFQTLAHEMVHVKQYAKRELGQEITLARGKREYCLTKWHGEYWKPKSREDGYFDSPWEIEAYGREVGLYKRWKDTKNAEAAKAAQEQSNEPK